MPRRDDRTNWTDPHAVLHHDGVVWPVPTLLAALVLAFQSAEVRWSAPNGCPDAGDLERRIDRHLGRPAAATPTQIVRAQGVIEPAGDGFVLRLWIEVHPHDARTEVSAERCESLTELAALKIAMAVDPMAVLDRVESLEDPEPAPPTTAVIALEVPPVAFTSPATDLRAPADAATDPKPRAPADKPRLYAALRASTAIGWGMLPGVGALVGGSVAVARGMLRVDAGGAYGLERATSATGPGAALRAGLASARGCVVPHWRTLAFPLCLGLQAGTIRGRGIGIAEPTIARRIWLGFPATMELLWVPNRRLGVFLGPQVVAVAMRPEFRIRGVGRVHRARAFTARAVAGVEIRLP